MSDSQNEETNTLIEENPTITTTSLLTHNDVIQKFEEISKKYTLKQGYMTTMLPDTFSEEYIKNNPQLRWKEVYNFNASNHVRIHSISGNIKVFGIEMPIILERPIKQDHHAEFEDYFNFGGHNSGFTTNRIVIRMRTTIDETINVRNTLTTDGEIDQKYADQVVQFMVFGGYIKYWSGYYDLRSWFFCNLRNVNILGAKDDQSSDFIHKCVMENIVFDADTDTDNDADADADAASI